MSHDKRKPSSPDQIQAALGGGAVRRDFSNDNTLATLVAKLFGKIGGVKTSPTVMDAVWGFFFLYVASFVMITIALNGVGVDPVTAYAAAAACITNLGPGLGEVSANYASLNSTAKVILSFAMTPRCHSFCKKRDTYSMSS